MQKLYNTIIQTGLIFLIIFTPLAFGSVQGWAVTIMELVTLLMVTAWFLKMIHQGELKFTKTPLNVPLLLFALFILFQLLPLSPMVLNYLSPNTYKLYQMTLPNDEELSTPAEFPAPQSAIRNSMDPNLQIQNPKSQIPNPKFHESAIRNYKDSKSEISIYSHATKGDLLKLLTYIAIFFLVINNLYKREQIKRILIVIVALGFAVSVFAFIQKFSGAGKIYWFQELTKGGLPYGPYVNRNHLAGYITMIIPLAFGLFALKFSRFYTSVSRKLPELLSSIVFLYILIVMITALVFSLSRGGMISFALSTALMLGLYLVSQKYRLKFALIPLMVGLIALIFLVYLDISPVVQRLSTVLHPEASGHDRIAVYKDTLKAIKDYPLFGTGLGTFQYIFPQYRDASAGFNAYYDYAHNDYLQLLQETGLPGFLILGVGLTAYILTILYKWGKRHDPFIKGLTICALAGVFAMLLHSLVDFNLHIPANALFFFLLLGLAYSLVHCEGRSSIHRQRQHKPSLDLAKET